MRPGALAFQSGFAPGLSFSTGRADLRVFREGSCRLFRF